MADTIGDIVDKLSIANIRLWHIEDERRVLEAQLRGPGLNDAEVKRYHSVVASVSTVNKERNSLIDQFNAGLAVLLDAAATHGPFSTFAVDKETLLGTGKNKFYATETNNRGR